MIDLGQYFTAVREENGIAFCSLEDNTASKFSEEMQDSLFQLEDTSWWFQYRADVIASLAEKSFVFDRTTIDCGGGNGYTTYCMQQKGCRIALLEPTLTACQNGKRRGLRTVVCGTLEKDTVKDGSIEQLLLLDVLEHIEDDAQFLRTVYEKLAPDGKLLLTVPAFQALWSSEDTAAGHYRRYRLEGLRRLAQASGFSVEYANYFMEFLFLPILFVRVGLERLGLLKPAGERTSAERKEVAEKQFKERGGVTRFALEVLERIELGRLLRGRRVRFGSSIICVLRKG